ncbi:uncharacterized protein LOC116426484 [Nomia melanderi]|uniref:uncharacterized protein LOC116426484 n=1 Tax=Nomia melanderi TaxID=2448451 RepID=UPI00130418AE|nr:uncharacterized protein LOC116426484 [Nomia melanderi]
MFTLQLRNDKNKTILVILERAGPLGTTGQRRPSRSPRSQRSRSADVDCLKKYTERRVEERRHTDIVDTSKLDPSRWIPLTKNMSRSTPTTSKKSPQSARDDEKRRSVTVDIEEAFNDILKPTVPTPKKLTPTKEEDATKGAEEKEDASTSTTATTTPGNRTATGRSHSAADVVHHAKNEKLVEERRHTEADPRMIATRWLPQINTSRFRYDATSPLARISSSEITKYAAARWLTFVKNPSPSPLPRMNPERKSSTSSAADAQRIDVKITSPKWEPMRKFSSVPTTKVDGDAAQEKDEAGSNRDSPSKKLSPDSAEQTNRLKQRMQDLYDFKTENEWPKRTLHARRENIWISKSSSEEDKSNQPVRRNSQDLEFNDRVKVIKLKDTKVQSDFQKPEESSPKKQESEKKGSEVFNSEYEERLKKFNERLRYSEDLGTAKPKLKERRTYSDDHEEKVRRTRSARTSRSDSTQDGRQPVLQKRNSDASTKSRGSYAEVSPVKRDSRTSDASYVSISAKRASVDCKSTQKMVELPPRRAFSQTEERPATPVPPVEWNDDRYAAARSKVLLERQKRDSTRYKVYLT